MKRGQALVEVALVLPIVFALALGAVSIVRLADARAGIDAATAAAASAAARAPDPTTAVSQGGAAFAAAAAGYALGDPRLTLDLGTFSRGSTIHAYGTATVAMAAPVPGLPRGVTLTSTAAARVESWRSR
ncbi:MAG TPA: TadE family protein [Candidatus Dormibacteraeota bacterium]